MSRFTRAVLAAARAPIVERGVTGTRPGRALAHRFVAGDTLDDATAAARVLNGGGLAVSLDLLGEEVDDRSTALVAADRYLASIERISQLGLDANVSVKLTQLGLAFDRGLAAESLARLGRAAAEHRTTVTVDMEDARYTQDTVDLYADGQAETGNLGIALQAYLHRTPEDLERLAPLGGHIRLCKGAYVEPATIAFQGRAEVDAAFALLLERLMSVDATRPAVATHDDRLIALARELAPGRTGGWEFQMLYGVRPELQRSLAADGAEVRIYLPFGSQWYPYLSRRIAERPANLAFFLRAITSRR
jgi:proline dehydrogenase